MSALDDKERTQLIRNMRLFMLILSDCAELMGWAAERGHPTAGELLVRAERLITGMRYWMDAYESKGK